MTTDKVKLDAAIEAARQFQIASKRKGLALEEIAALPLGDHRAKQIAQAALGHTTPLSVPFVDHETGSTWPPNPNWPLSPSPVPAPAKCLGYPLCDGNLPGEPHVLMCPMVIIPETIPEPDKISRTLPPPTPEQTSPGGELCIGRIENEYLDCNAPRGDNHSLQCWIAQNADLRRRIAELADDRKKLAEALDVATKRIVAAERQFEEAREALRGMVAEFGKATFGKEAYDEAVRVLTKFPTDQIRSG